MNMNFGKMLNIIELKMGPKIILLFKPNKYLIQINLYYLKIFIQLLILNI